MLNPFLLNYAHHSEKRSIISQDTISLEILAIVQKTPSSS